MELMLINLWEKEMTGGRSASIILFLSRESAALFGLEGRTADGSPLGCGQSASVLKNHPERLFLWLGLKGWTADGPAHGRGRSAGHLTF